MKPDYPQDIAAKISCPVFRVLFVIHLPKSRFKKSNNKQHFQVVETLFIPTNTRNNFSWRGISRRCIRLVGKQNSFVSYTEMNIVFSNNFSMYSNYSSSIHLEICLVDLSSTIEIHCLSFIMIDIITVTCI